MNEDKPQTRLVGWDVYLRTTCKRTILSVSACGLGCFGVSILLVTVVGVVRFGAFRQDLKQSLVSFCIAIGMYCGAGIGLLRWAKALSRKAKNIELVAPITRHNTGHLPEVETLVRGSDRPATAEQAELLRAVRQSPETPPEQLLRAAQENRQDV
jgi:hypothetical protein